MKLANPVLLAIFVAYLVSVFLCRRPWRTVDFFVVAALVFLVGFVERRVRR